MEAILGLGLTNAVMAGALAIAAAIVSRVARRPALAHGLWMIVMVKLITPPLWNVALPDVRSWIAAKTSTAEPVMYEFVEVVDDDLDDIEAEAVALPESPPPAPPFYTQINWPVVAALVWGGGSLIWLSSAVLRIRRFHTVIRQADLAPPDVQMLTDSIAERLGLRVAPEVWTTAGTISPLVWAFGGPARLLIPEILWKSLNHTQRSTLITHELAHLRRHDHRVRWIELAATAIYWWCPVLWWARRELREAEEQCCDAWVVWAWPKAAKAYATALLETLDFLAETRTAVPLAASGAGHVRQLKRRMTMILRGLTPRSLPVAGRLALVGLGALLLPMIPTLAQDAPKAEKEAKELHATFTEFTDKLDDDNVTFFFVDDDKEKKEADEKDEKGEKSEKSQKKIEVKTQFHALPRTPLGVITDIKGASKEDAEALKKAHAEVRDLEEQLAKARKRVAEIETKVSGRLRVTRPVRVEVRRMQDGGKEQTTKTTETKVEGRGRVLFEKGADGKTQTIIVRQNPDGTLETIKGDTNVRFLAVPAVPPVPPATPAVPIPPRGVRSVPAPEQDAKLRRIEEQLRDLQNAIRELKDRKPEADSDRTTRVLKQQFLQENLQQVRQAQLEAEAKARKVQAEIKQKLFEANKNQLTEVAQAQAERARAEAKALQDTIRKELDAQKREIETQVRKLNLELNREKLQLDREQTRKLSLESRKEKLELDKIERDKKSEKAESPKEKNKDKEKDNDKDKEKKDREKVAF